MTRSEKAAGCIMCDSLYIKPDGNMPCWDDVGEDLILRKLDEKKLVAGDESPVFTSPALVDLRRAFMRGETPHPDFCSRCPLYGHGVARALEPRVMNVLHVEPVFLCQLACPQCFTPKERLLLKKPPYYMTLEFYRGLLSQLRREGVEHIRLVHFEGRGEPLLHPQLGDMIAATKEIYPGAFVMVTSHGNFPYKPWMHTSGLDVLRLSVDGAFEESYQRYRVGGRLAKALRLMADLLEKRQEYPQSPLRIEWKFILFEWNDSDEEMRRAAEIAERYQVRLRFCLTHTPGRSLRFVDARDLEKALGNIAPEAGFETTFQLRQEPSDADSGHVLAEHVEASLMAALGSYRRDEPARAEWLLAEAVAVDPGLKIRGDDLWTKSPDEVAKACRFPGTAVALANIAQHLHHWQMAEALYRRYLALAPSAADREKIEITALELAVGNRLGRHVKEAADATENARQEAEKVIFELDPALRGLARGWRRKRWNSTELSGSQRRQIAEMARPQTLVQLAYLRIAEGELRSARSWLEAALSLSEQAPAESSASAQRSPVPHEIDRKELTVLLQNLAGLPRLPWWRRWHRPLSPGTPSAKQHLKNSI